MRKFITAQAGAISRRVAWLSFQPDGSISFGLNDRAFVPRRLRIVQGIWNAYNRRRARFELGMDQAALETVQNPHFTFHPPGLFHLKANEDRVQDEQEVFRGVARVGVAVDQDGEMPWIRAISAPLHRLPEGGVRNDGIVEDEWLFRTTSERNSVSIAVDFIRPEAVGHMDNDSCWSVAWGAVAIRVKAAFTFPRDATLSWMYDH
jgi:hypothetical protein